MRYFFHRVMSKMPSSTESIVAGQSGPVSTAPADETTQRLRLIVDTIIDGIITIDSAGVVLTFNPAAERIFGYSSPEVIGQNVKRLMPQPYHGEHDRYIADYLSTGIAKIIGIGREVVGRRRDGTTFPMDLAVSEFRLGNARLFTGIVRDITERKRAEAELRETARELARSNVDLQHFAYVASHDLQEPLRAVSGCIEILERRYGNSLDARGSELIQHTVNGVKWMQALIDGLLAFSRVGTRGKSLEATDFNLLFKAALANLAPAIAESNATVTQDRLPVVRADGAQVIQVFQNLISNAIKFRSQGKPQIHVGVQRGEGEWVFRVRDNGIGIEPQYFDRIFVIFQRLHTRDEYPGTGIGLAICKKIVERHGGRMWVDSKPGSGSCFYFSIPATGETHERSEIR